MGRVIHFEIHAADPERAVAFYHAIFGWHIQRFNETVDYWLATTGDEKEVGINGAILRRRGDNPPADHTLPIIGATIIIDVKNIDVTMQNIKDRGCQIVVDKTEVPGVGWTAYSKDTEGNIFGMMQAHEPTK